jgi:hypothetical protein
MLRSRSRIIFVEPEPKRYAAPAPSRFSITYNKALCDTVYQFVEHFGLLFIRDGTGAASKFYPEPNLCKNNTGTTLQSWESGFGRHCPKNR